MSEYNEQEERVALELQLRFKGFSALAIKHLSSHRTVGNLRTYLDSTKQDVGDINEICRRADALSQEKRKA